MKINLLTEKLDSMAIRPLFFLKEGSERMKTEISPSCAFPDGAAAVLMMWYFGPDRREVPML